MAWLFCLIYFLHRITLSSVIPLLERPLYHTLYSKYLSYNTMCVIDIFRVLIESSTKMVSHTVHFISKKKKKKKKEEKKLRNCRCSFVWENEFQGSIRELSSSGWRSLIEAADVDVIALMTEV